MMKSASVLTILVAVVASASPLLAQKPDDVPAVMIVVVRDAPIHIVINGVLAPYRYAKKGSMLRLLETSNDWYRVEFGDPRGGVREGWIEMKYARFVRPDESQMQPMDLSVPGARPAPEVASVQPPQAPRTAPSPFTTAETSTHTRRGFWFNIGLGVGSLGCDNCGGRAAGLSGGLSLGGTLGEKWLLGVGTTGWARDVFGETLSVGTLDARVRFYPSLTSGFFITGGLGAGSISFGSESEFGAGAMFGVGWDIRVSRNVSLTPFYNGFAMRSSLVDANVGQIGLGVTIH